MGEAADRTARHTFRASAAAIRVDRPGLIWLELIRTDPLIDPIPALDQPEDVDFTAIFSRRDGIVDWRACVDPAARPVEVRSSHVGMAFDPVVITAVSAALRPAAATSAVEVDRGQSA